MPARFLLLPALLVLAGCQDATDSLNIDCDLVKEDPNDGGIAFILEQEIKEGAGKDFISFGSTDCEDFVCVRDASFVRNPDPMARAKGYCSKSCLQGATCASQDPADDNKADRKLTCRPLLLDPATISAICIASPGESFCSVKSPYFCARGGSVDGGS